MRNKRFPKYPDDADYNTNSPSYYDDLARKQKLIELLAKKIWEYEETLDLTLEEISERLESYIEENDTLMKDRLDQWDLNLEKFPENVELLLQEWLSDGTLDHIINETIFNWKADKTFVDSEIERLEQKDENITTHIDSEIERLEQKDENITTQMTQNIELFGKSIKNQIPATIKIPQEFGYFNHIIVNRDDKGVYTTNLDFDNLIQPADEPFYYVDIVNGNDVESAGTEENPYKTLSYANSKNAKNIIVKEGTYYHDEAYAGGGQYIIGEGKVDLIRARRTNWVQHENTRVYKATISGGTDHVWDFDQSLSIKERLRTVDSLSECVSSPGTYFKDGSTYYVHKYNSSVVDNDVHVSLSVVLSVVRDGETFYAKGINFYLGTSFVVESDKFVAENCSFSYRGSANGVNFEGSKETYLKNCSAYHNRLDGFNYHRKDTVNSISYEENCIGMRNGFEEGSNNGSTIHGECVILRVGGVHTLNQGDNVADVNSSKSCNIGVKASDSLGYKRDFNINNGWLISCYSTSNTSLKTNLVNNNDQIAYVKDNVFTGKVEGNVVTIN